MSFKAQPVEVQWSETDRVGHNVIFHLPEQRGGKNKKVKTFFYL